MSEWRSQLADRAGSWLQGLNIIRGSGAEALDRERAAVTSAVLQWAQPLSSVLFCVQDGSFGSGVPSATFSRAFRLELEVCPCIDLRRFRIHMPQEVADHLERDTALQQMHALRVAQAVWAHPGCVKPG